MIDFRYHLISLIAVFLALGLGILMGSVVLSEKYVNRLENRVTQFEEELDARREEVSALNDRIDAFQEFAVESQPRLVEGALAGEEIVVFETDGTDEAMVEGLTEAVEEAGGTVISTFTLTDRFSLTDQPERDQLALILGSTRSEAGDLREEAGAMLGQRAAAVASARVGVSESDLVNQRFMTLVRDLEEEGFLGLSSADDLPVPAGASFIVAGGAEEEPPEGVVDLSKSLALGLSDRQRAVLVAEAGNSAWEVVSSVRDDGALNAAVSTADHAETVPGRVAVALGLELAIEGLVGHYGVEDGASSVVPPPSPRA